MLATVEEGFRSPALTTTAGSPSLQEALSKTVADFENQFNEHAQSPADFHRLLSQAFGSIDADRAESIRQFALDNDFSWLPKIELVSGDPNFRGAYSAEEGTVFLNQDLLDDPADASAVLTEELGHHLETLVREGDSPGDEGAVFGHTLLEEKLNPETLATRRRENDHGILKVDGREVRVEFFDSFVNPILDGSIQLNSVSHAEDLVTDVPTFTFDDNADTETKTFTLNRLAEAKTFTLNGPVEAKTFTFVDDVDTGDFDPATGTIYVDPRDDIDIVNGTTDDGLHFAPLANGRIIGPDARWAFALTKVAGTHNSYEIVATKTPYDDGAQASGIPWQELDRAYLDLKARGLNEQADLLQNDGVLPPLNAFEPGSPIETALRGHYDRLAQQ